jgi:hypothetical protein
MPVGTTFVTSRTRQWEPSSIEIVNAPGQIERRAMWAGASSSNVVNAAAALIVAALVIAALILGRDFLLPLALATLLSFALQPAVRWLEDYKLPRPAAVALVVLSLIATAVAARCLPGRRRSRDSPKSCPAIRRTCAPSSRTRRAQLGSVGIWRTATEVLRNVGGDLTERPKGGEPVKVEVQNEQSSPFMVFAKYLQLSLSPLTSAALVLLFTIFILLQYHDLRDRIVRVMGPAEIGRSAQALNDAAWSLLTSSACSWGSISPSVLSLVPASGSSECRMLHCGAQLPRSCASCPISAAPCQPSCPWRWQPAVEPGWTMLLLTAALFGVAELITAR